MSERFILFKDQERPSLSEYITLNDKAVQFGPSDTAKLQAHLSGATGSLKIDFAAVIEDAATGLVRYDWQPGDTDTAGNLIAWWRLSIAGKAQSSPAFVIPIVNQATVDQGAGVYASVLDVKALAGFLSNAWTPISDTSESDIGVFLAMTSGEIDAILLSLSATLPLDPVGPPAVSLRSLTADGALVRALGATWPYNAPEGVAELRTDARTRYQNGITELIRGKHPAALAIASTAGSTSAGSSLWQDDPSYGRWGWYPDLLDRNPALAPSVHKGQVF